MNGVVLRSESVRDRGPYHHRLVELLRDATKRGVCTQESLGGAIGKTQTGVGKYLLGKGGALDVDEAANALEHIGSSLEHLMKQIPPKDLTESEKLVRALATRPELIEFVKDLLPVPRARLAGLIDPMRAIAKVTTWRRGTPGDESESGTLRASDTKSGPKRRR